MADSASTAAAAAASGGAATPTPGQAIDFLNLLQHLKVCASCLDGGLDSCIPTPAPSQGAHPQPHSALQTQKRTGWVKRGVAGPESIADHMYRMGAMALLAQGGQYDYNRCVRDGWHLGVGAVGLGRLGGAPCCPVTASLPKLLLLLPPAHLLTAA